MKITYNTAGFLNDGSYQKALPFFLQQYNDRFPGIEYLHLELKGADEGPDENSSSEQFYYSSSGNMLKIQVVKQTGKTKPTSYEVLSELRDVFDAGVEEHLKNHQDILRYSPEY